ncbi:type VI secretion system Vgr family protein [Luteimonas qiangzhengi]|uniref:type VI secretion system Vgr family protein n=1 Tax=Luteimonas sp. MJ146 TaxID=3129240 RepID=UPI0031BA8242
MHGASGAAAQLAALVGVDDANRLYRLELADAGAPLIVERWAGHERLAGEFQWTVDVLSTRADLPLDDWLGQPATLLTRLADGDTARRSGLVREAACLGADGGLARYRLTLAPWTWLMTQGRHSRVFQDRSVVEIVESVFAGYAPLSAWQLGEEVGPFLAETRPRSYCVQYRETDATFVQRLLAEEGLGWRLEEDSEAAAGHRLVLFADSAAQPEDATSARDGGLRYHRSDGTEARDSVQGIGLRRRIGADRMTVLGQDYKSVRAIAAQLPLQNHGHELTIEDYDPSGAYAFADAGQAERHARLMAQATEAGRERWLGHGTARTLRTGTWFQLTQAPVAGSGSPPQELLVTGLHHVGINNLPVDLRESVEAELGEAPDWGVDVPEEMAGHDLLPRARAVGYANAFVAVDRNRPWRPILLDWTGRRLNPRPTAPGYQTAIVVGADGQFSPSGHQELHSDALGRVRVKFHWQQGQAAGDQDTCWLRVAQRYAGPGVGSQFLPRIGQEVLVAFLEGDIDRPLVTGALYNGRGEAGIAATPGGEPAEQDLSAYAQAADHAASAQANLAGGNAPAWHGMGSGEESHRNAGALWGIQSKEWGGEGHSRLVFDDSDDQLRLQLATTQAASQLNLGHLIHQANNYRGSFRGEGFELRTDAWGAVRAGSGLWLSAYAKSGDTPAGDAVAPAALLTQLRSLGETFSQAAATHQTVKLAGHEGAKSAASSRLVDTQAPLAALLASVKTTVTGEDFDSARGEADERSPAAGEGKVPHTGDALLGLAAPAGIGFVAGQSLTWSVGETLTLASGQSSNLAIAGNLRLHSGQAIGLLAAAVEGQTEDVGLSVVSGEGELDLQSQNNQIRIRSRDQLKLVSANAEVDLAAGKAVHLATSGGASLTIEGGNIVIACPGEIKVHAGKKSFVGPTQLSREMNSWPETKFDQNHVVRYEHSGEPIRDWPVEIVRADGARIRLMTDDEGRLPIQKSQALEKVQVRVLRKNDRGQE